MVTHEILIELRRQFSNAVLAGGKNVLRVEWEARKLRGRRGDIAEKP